MVAVSPRSFFQGNTMVQRHDSTPIERAQVVCQMIAHAGDDGVVTRLSRQIGVSRQTLYTWSAQASQALEEAFRPAPPAPALAGAPSAMPAFLPTQRASGAGAIPVPSLPARQGSPRPSAGADP